MKALLFLLLFPIFSFSQSRDTIEDAEMPYDDGAGTNPRIQIYKNGSNSKVAAKGNPTLIGFDITQTNTIGYGTTSGGTVIKVLENGEDKTDEWGTGSKDFEPGVLPNLKFIYTA